MGQNIRIGESSIESRNTRNRAYHSFISTFANVPQMSRAGGHLKGSSCNGICGNTVDEKIHRTSCLSPAVGDMGIIGGRSCIRSGKCIVGNACPGESKSTSIRPLLITKAIARVSIGPSDVTIFTPGDWITTQNKFKSGITRNCSKIEGFDI